MHIQECVDVEPLTRDGVDVDGVHLYQIARGSHFGTVRTLVRPLPGAAAPEESVALQRSFHRAETDINTILLQDMMDDFTAPPVLLPAPEDRGNGAIGKFPWMMVRPGTAGRDIVLPEIHSLSDPTHDGARLVSKMPGNGPHAPSQTDELHGFPPDPRGVRIGGVGHVWHCGGGCCEAIEPLRSS